MKLKIMTYNIASGRYYHNDEDINSHGGSRVVGLSKCGDVIRQIAPDFCGLNEINMYSQHDLDALIPNVTQADQTTFLAQYTGLTYGYFGKAIHFANRGDYGNAVISQHPILESEVIAIPDPEIKDENNYYETRSITKVKLDIAGGITVLQVHVGLAIAESQNAVVELCRVIDETEGPIILMGDFNMCPGNFLLDRLRERLLEIRPMEEGYHHTFPSWTHDADLPARLKNYPYCKIDYIFASHHFRQLDCTVHPVRVSDHMPLLATLEL